MTAAPLASRIRSEKGASLIQVALAIIVLSGFCAFVLDQGVMLWARGEAQNAADAGALSGAIARAFDETADPPASGGLAETAARSVALQNSVGDAGGTTHVSVMFSPTVPCPAFAAGGKCTRVDVFRDGTLGSTTLPAFFANIFGITSQQTKASAVAWAVAGNQVNCMRPFGVIDKWLENGVATNNTTGHFDRWISSGPNAVQIATPDVYAPPDATSTGTGYTVQLDLGTEVLLKGGNNPNSASGPVTPGWFLPLQLPDGMGGYFQGASDYRYDIGHCSGNGIVSIGDYLPTETGAMVGPTRQGVGDLIQLDPGASWSTSSNAVINSCAPASCGGFSPRIVPIAVLDADEFQWRSTANNWTNKWTPGQGTTPGQPAGTGFSCPIGGRCVRVSNILGFFVEQMQGNDVLGRIVMVPGKFASGGSNNVNSGASFVTVIQLIR
jgi:Flp pilus assembly protein TadG